MVCCTKEQMKRWEDYLDEGHGPEKLTKMKTAWITACLCLFGWLGLEGFHEGLVMQLELFGPGFHHSAIHRYFWGGRENGGEQCSTHAQTCPLWEAVADCGVQTREFLDYQHRSILMGHTITTLPWIRVPINCIHIFGACAVGWYACIMLVSGGSTAHAPWKKSVMKQLWMTVCSMAVTGTIMFCLRGNADRGFPSTNLAPSLSGASEIQPPEFNFFHDLGRVSYFIAFSGGFINNLGNGVIHYICPPKVLVVSIGICLVAELFATIIFTYQLCTTNWLWYPWASQMVDLELLSLYPVLDGLNAYALYQAWYKNKEYDWDAHRSFNISAFFLIGFTVVMYFATIDYGILFNRPTLLYEKMFVPVPGLVFFIFFALIVHLQHLMALRTAGPAKEDASSFRPLNNGDKA